MRCKSAPRAILTRAMSEQPRLALLPSDSPRAREAAEALRADGGFVPLEKADVVVVVGGDGHMLHVLHTMLDAGVALAPGAYEVLFPGLAHSHDIIDHVVSMAYRAANGLAGEVAR